MKKVVVYCALGIVVLAFLGIQASCTTLRIDYRSVQRWENSEEDRPDMREQLRIVFTSPDDLSQVAYSGGLACRLEFPSSPELDGVGWVRRDLSDSAWGEVLPSGSSGRPECLRFQADVVLSLRDLGSRSVNASEALVGRDHGDAHFIVYRPSKPFILCSSDPVVIPARDLAAAVQR